MAVHAQYVTLGACGEVFAVPVERVQEILDARPISRQPHMPAAMLGIIDVRGRTIPVLDLCHAIGFAPAADTGNTRILVLTLEVGSDQATLAARVDRVFEVTSLDAPLEPAAANGDGWAATCVAGIGRRHGAIVTVLDIDLLLGALDVCRP